MTADDERDWMVGGPSWLQPDLGVGLRYCIWRQNRLSGVTQWIEVSRDFTGDPRQAFADADPATIGRRVDR
jgi:hypothetical protein